MIYKGILLDIDNTLYNYKKCHDKALTECIHFLAEKTGHSLLNLKKLYAQARDQIHTELPNTAASHNRLIYFQRMSELLKLNPIKFSLDLYVLYWDVFIENIELYEGVIDLLDFYSNKPIGFISDLTADIQHRKIKALGLLDYVGSIITSEEAGREKPNKIIFSKILKKMNCTTNDVCMVGDDFDKDISGAVQLGIPALWLNIASQNTKITSSLIKQFNNFNAITKYLING